MKGKKPNHLRIVCALIGQVMEAQRGHAGTERDIVTLITRPLWELWCKELGASPNEKPCIYGSKTVIIESDTFRSMSIHKSHVELIP